MVDDREVAGAQPLDEILRPPPEPGRADDLGHCSGSAAIAVRNSSPPSMRSSSVRRSAAESSSITRLGRVAGHLLDAEVPGCDVRDLRQVRDRDHLSALGEAAQRLGDAVRRDAADAGVDLVEDERLTARDDGERERHARELAARGRVGDRAEGHAGVGPDQEDGLVAAARPWFALLQLDAELALPHADALEVLGNGSGEGLDRGGSGPCGARRSRRRSPASARASSAAAAASGSRPPSSASRSAAAV